MIVEDIHQQLVDDILLMQKQLGKETYKREQLEKADVEHLIIVHDFLSWNLSKSGWSDNTCQ